MWPSWRIEEWYNYGGRGISLSIVELITGSMLVGVEMWSCADSSI